MEATGSYTDDTWMKDWVLEIKTKIDFTKMIDVSKMLRVSDNTKSILPSGNTLKKR